MALDLAWRVFQLLAYQSLDLEVAELSVAEEDEEGLYLLDQAGTVAEVVAASVAEEELEACFPAQQDDVTLGERGNPVLEV